MSIGGDFIKMTRPMSSGLHLIFHTQTMTSEIYQNCHEEREIIIMRCGGVWCTVCHGVNVKNRCDCQN